MQKWEAYRKPSYALLSHSVHTEMFQAFAKALPDLQVEPNYEKAPQKADANTNFKHIARFTSRANPVDPEPLSLTVPYGQILTPKLIEKLASEELTLRLAASNQLYIMFNQKEENVVDCIRHDGVRALLHALKDEDVHVRTNVASALRIVCSVWAGHVEILRLDGIPVLLEALQDDHAGVVYHALQALVNLDAPADEHAATAKLIELGAIHTYLEVIERTQFKLSGASAAVVPALGALTKCCNVKEGFVKVLDSKATPVLSMVLTSPLSDDHVIVAAAARCVSALGIFSTARRVLASGQIAAALVARVGSLLAQLFSEQEPDESFPAMVDAVVALCSALYATSVEPQIRRDLVEAGLIPLIDSVLQAGETPMRGVIVRLSVMLSEDAIGRQSCAQLRQSLEAVAQEGEGSQDALQAKRALQHLDGKRSTIM